MNTEASKGQRISGRHEATQSLVGTPAAAMAVDATGFAPHTEADFLTNRIARGPLDLAVANRVGDSFLRLSEVRTMFVK
jgi:hypothetical protein